jgi:hypothetical protein
MWQAQQRFTFDANQTSVMRFLHAATMRWRYYFMETAAGSMHSLWTDKPFGFCERTDPPPALPGDGPADVHRIQDHAGAVGKRQSSNGERRLLHLEWQHSVPSSRGRSLLLCLFGPGVPGHAFLQSFVAEIQLRQEKSRECTATLLVNPSPIWQATEQPVADIYVWQVGDLLCVFWEGLIRLWDHDKGHWGADEQPASALEATKASRGPTVRTRERANVFKRLKDKHPEWGYDTVALQARDELKVTDITAETVRNAYRQMGWIWQRADRVR